MSLETNVPLVAVAWQGPPPMPALLTVGVFALVCAFFLAQVAAIRTWRGSWRALALVPAGIMLCVLLRIALYPASDTPWVSELVIWSGCCLGLLGLAGGARALFTSRRERA